jgi:outer membrane lipoprotein-sorting protein
MGRLMVTAVLMAVGIGSPVPVCALTAREILDRAKELDDTTRKWTDRTQTMTLHIHGKGGGERERTLAVLDKRYADGQDKSISFFLAPPEVKGTGFLQWSLRGRDDDQWLYLPELKRTRRITSRLRDQSFMGTDFSYGDLDILGEIQDWTEQDAPSALTGSEAVDGRACHVIELRPQQRDALYGRIVIWVDQELLVTRKIEFHGTDGTHLKTLTQQDIREVGPIPTAHRLEMRSLKKETRTEVELSDIGYDRGLSDEVFTERQLKRGAP